MGLFTDTDAATIKKHLIERAQSGCNTTLYAGDERRIFIESVITPIFVAMYNKVDDIAKQKMRRYARGEVLDAIGGEDCKRLEAKKATTVLQFYTNEAAEEDIIIPAGTTVTTNDDHDFMTNVEATLKRGTLDITVLATAAEGGAEYNDFTAGTIAVIVDDIDVDGCKNITVSTGGDDGEPYDTDGDDRYRERIALHEDAESTCGTESSYRYYALTADSTIADAKVINPEEKGETSEYDVIVYLICTNGVLPSEDIITAAQNECTADDHRPMCDYVSVQAATQISYEVDLSVYVGEADAEKAQSIISDAVNKYIETQDTSISEAINPDQLFAKIMKAQDENENYLDIQRCIITAPAYTELNYNQVGKCVNINISYVTV